MHSAESSINSVSQLTCPECGHVSVETMPTNACLYFHDCAASRDGIGRFDQIGMQVRTFALLRETFVATE